jgi:hypothetical protein
MNATFVQKLFVPMQSVAVVAEKDNQCIAVVAVTFECLNDLRNMLVRFQQAVVVASDLLTDGGTDTVERSITFGTCLPSFPPPSCTWPKKGCPSAQSFQQSPLSTDFGPQPPR